MIHFINTIIKINQVDLDSVANYTKLKKEDIIRIISDFEGKFWNFPEGINNLINKIKLLDFD